MATRSTIALEYADGTVGQVYCHWDGYLDNNGAILAQYYQDPFKVRALLDNGDLSSLGPNLGDQHEFDCPHKYGTPEYTAWSDAHREICTFYGRDRGETGTESRNFATVAEWQEHYTHTGCEFFYLLQNKEWWYFDIYDVTELTPVVFGLLAKD